MIQESRTQLADQPVIDGLPQTSPADELRQELVSNVHQYPTHAEAIRKLGDQYSRTRLTPFVKQGRRALWGICARWIALRSAVVFETLETLLKHILVSMGTQSDGRNVCRSRFNHRRI